MNTLPPGGYRHRTSDTWEALALWAEGWPVLGTEADHDRRIVSFLFPDGGDDLRDAVQAHRTGTLMVRSLALREGYRQLRAMVDQELRYEQHT